MYRQGDVLIESAERAEKGEFTTERLLVMGEGRNHGHFITGDEVKVYRVQDELHVNDHGTVTHYIEITGIAVLEHLNTETRSHTSEHMPITIPPGYYRVIRQREYNPYLKAIRVVKD